MANSIEYVLGIDGGGTKCHARLENLAGEVLAECITGPANPAQDTAEALASITQAMHALPVQAGLPPRMLQQTRAVLGLAGISVPAYAAIVRQWTLPVSNVTFTTDLHIACAGAHGTDTGAIIITGTGSSAFVTTSQGPRILGGHGFPLGDKASGAWLGWRALSYTLETLDALHPPSGLSRAICQQAGTSDAAQLVAQSLHLRSAGYAAFAPLVFAQAQLGDHNARDILAEGGDYLRQLAAQIATHKPARFSLIGGLAKPWLPWLPSDLTTQLSAPLGSPVEGAVALARGDIFEPTPGKLQHV